MNGKRAHAGIVLSGIGGKFRVETEDGIREIVDLWKNEDSGEIAPVWSEHLDWLIKRLISEQEA